MHDAQPDIDVPFSQEVEAAFARLVEAVDLMHATPPILPTFDSQHYLALSHRPLAYPWFVLTLDLKAYIPLMDRHVLIHMVAGLAHHQPQFTHPAYVLGSFLKDLAHAIVNNILAPLTSEYMRPPLPLRLFTPEMPASALTPRWPLWLPWGRWTGWRETSCAGGITLRQKQFYLPHTSLSSLAPVLEHSCQSPF